MVLDLKFCFYFYSDFSFMSLPVFIGYILLFFCLNLMFISFIFIILFHLFSNKTTWSIKKKKKKLFQAYLFLTSQLSLRITALEVHNCYQQHYCKLGRDTGRKRIVYDFYQQAAMVVAVNSAPVNKVSRLRW